MAIKKVRMKPPGYTDIVHPETSADVVIEDASHRFVTDSEKGIWNAKQAAITGGATTITSLNLTASRALVSDASGKVAVSSATSTELGYLSGVTSSVQTQLNGKADTIHNHPLDGLSNVTITSNTNGEILRWNGTRWVNNTLAEAGIHKAVTGLTPHMILYSGTDGYGATNVHYFTLEDFFTDTPQDASAKEIYDRLQLKIERNNDVGSGVGVGTLTIADANLLEGYPASHFATYDEHLFAKSESENGIADLQYELGLSNANIGLGGVVESGSNTNGSYVKYGDGTMICRHSSWRTANGSGNIDASLSFPTLFTGSPILIGQLQDTGHQSWTGNLQTGDVVGNSARIIVTGATANLSYYINYIAIGRWK